MEMQITLYLTALFFMKLNMNAVTATSNIIKYCTMVTDVEAQKESAGTSVKVRLHCSMLTAYFWKGKMAE